MHPDNESPTYEARKTSATAVLDVDYDPSSAGSQEEDDELPFTHRAHHQQESLSTNCLS